MRVYTLMCFVSTFSLVRMNITSTGHTRCMTASTRHIAGACSSSNCLMHVKAGHMTLCDTLTQTSIAAVPICDVSGLPSDLGL